MRYKALRESADLASMPDLVVIYLGMRVRSWRGLLTLLRTGPRIDRAVSAKPDGLLLHESFVFGILPPHLGMRQYWRDFAALEAWARSDPHGGWWKELLADPKGTSFWHETYSMRGGMEAIYLDMADRPIGLGKVAPREPARKSMFSSRARLGVEGAPSTGSAVSETEVYGDR
ncbi:MAG: monooxygenase family protein [Nocardioides sp.]